MGDTAPATLTIAVLGIGGRMGRAVESLLASAPHLRLSGGWSRTPDCALSEGAPAVASTDLDAALRGAAVAVDFTLPAATPAVAAACARVRCALVSGVTGLTASGQEALQEASQSVAVLHATNMSAGAHVLMHLAGRAAGALDEAGWDAEILDVHHRDKRDAPSGTALSLGEAVAMARGHDLGDVLLGADHGRQPGTRTGGIGFSAQRGGGVVGEHTVSFLADFESLALTHRATDRRVFAAGALRAASWIAGRPAGRYTMQQVLGLS